MFKPLRVPTNKKYVVLKKLLPWYMKVNINIQCYDYVELVSLDN